MDMATTAATVHRLRRQLALMDIREAQHNNHARMRIVATQWDAIQAQREVLSHAGGEADVVMAQQQVLRREEASVRIIRDILLRQAADIRAAYAGWDAEDVGEEHSSDEPDEMSWPAPGPAVRHADDAMTRGTGWVADLN